MIGEDLEGRGPSRPLADGANTVSRLRRSVALQGIGQQWQLAVATMIDEDLEGRGPSRLFEKHAGFPAAQCIDLIIVLAGAFDTFINSRPRIA